MSTQSRTLGDWIFLLLLVLIWGSSFATIKYSIEFFTPFWIAAIRLSLAAILMILFAIWRGIQLPQGKKQWLACAIMGSFGTAVPFMLINYASQYVPSSIAGLMMATVPIQVMLMSLIFLPAEKATPIRVLGLICGFLGVSGVILGNGAEETAAAAFSLLPFLLLVLATAGYATNGMVSRNVLEMPAMTKSLGVLIFGSLTALGCALMFDPLPTGVPLNGWAAITYLAILPTWATTLILYKLLDDTSAAFVAQSNYLIPAASIIFGAVLFGEQLAALQFVGFALILFGVAVSEGVIRRRRKKKRQYPPPPSA
ncbi:DMT family transporter [Maritalea mediterranea]|uniref:EamA family transporter n=1 Tax=Maritalea mediterranea TaxID=2909667 RepID=A0ABS9EC09_9HYPH|nr:EamA family transporter [Maritalea mediterranea]MCF4099699.1 EamA family transporter [Maritalea mediterranea]